MCSFWYINVKFVKRLSWFVPRFLCSLSLRFKLIPKAYSMFTRCKSHFTYQMNGYLVLAMEWVVVVLPGYSSGGQLPPDRWILLQCLQRSDYSGLRFINVPQRCPIFRRPCCTVTMRLSLRDLVSLSVTASKLLPACTLVSCWTYFFYPEDGGNMFPRNVGWHSTDYTALYPRRWYSS
jgi:hypothetical protein